MRILSRIAFALAAVFSAVLLLATIVLWIHSYSTVEATSQLKTLDPPKPVAPELRDVGPMAARREISCNILCGSLSAEYCHISIGGEYPSDLPTPDGWTRTSLPAPRFAASFPRLQQSILGFGYEHRQCRIDALWPDVLSARNISNAWLPKLTPMTEHWVVQVPCWALAAVTAALPLAWAWSLWRRRRYPAGHCRKCGYDLRGSPRRCPECGVAAA